MPPKYLTKAILAKLPRLRQTDKMGDQAVVQVKFFTPDGDWTWYATEFDKEDTFFGLVDGFEMELGYFSLSEIKTVRGSLGLPVERDLHFKPQTLGEVKKHVRELRGG